MKKILLKTNIFYGWFIVAAGFLIMSTAWGIVYNCTSIFIKPISDDMGFSRSHVSVIITLLMSCQMLVGLISGKVFGKFKIKRLMQLSTLGLILSYYTYSLSNSLKMFYIITIIVSISSAFLTVLPLSLIISNWFYEKRGIAIGLAFMGSGIGGMILSSLTGIWITAYGWRVTYEILAFLMLVILTPCTFLIIEINPKDIGLTQLGKPNDKSKIEFKNNEEGLNLSDAKKTFKFWALIMCVIVGCMGMATSFFTISSHLNDSGYSLTYSANVVSFTMGSLAISKLILGRLFDKFGVRLATIISTIANMLGLIGLIYVDYKIALVFIIFGTGLGNAFGTIALPFITEKMFGRKDFSSIYGLIFAANSFGGVIAPTLNGVIFDRTGSYNISYILMITLTIILIAAFSLILPNEKKYKKDISVY